MSCSLLSLQGKKKKNEDHIQKLLKITIRIEKFAALFMHGVPLRDDFKELYLIFKISCGIHFEIAKTIDIL